MQKDELRRMTRAALLEEAKKLEIRGRSAMSKEELVEAIAARGRPEAKSEEPKPQSRSKTQPPVPTGEDRSAAPRGRKPAAGPGATRRERPQEGRAEPQATRGSSRGAGRAGDRPAPPPPPPDEDEDEDDQKWNSIALGRDPNYGRFLSPGSIPPRPGAPGRRGAPPNGGPRPIGPPLFERSERGRLRAVERAHGAREELRRSGDARRQSGYTPKYSRPGEARGDRPGRPGEGGRLRDPRGDSARPRPEGGAGHDRRGGARPGAHRQDLRRAGRSASGRDTAPAGFQEDVDLGVESREEMILDAPRGPREPAAPTETGLDREAPALPAVKPLAGLTPSPAALPRHYGIDRCRLMVRDPRCVHAYWEIRPETLDRARGDLGDDWEGTKRILRIHGIPISGDENEPSADFFDLDVTDEATSWYVPVPRPNRGYRVDIGVMTRGGLFYPLASSNTVITPREEASRNHSESWASPPAAPGAPPVEAPAPAQTPSEVSAPAATVEPVSIEAGPASRAGALGPDFSGAGRMAEGSAREALFESGRGLLPPGPGIPPGAEAPTSPAGARPAARRAGGFWFVLNTELIVYGATEPDAKVTLQGKPVRLRPDGTFSLRFQLPDGVQELRAEAVSADGRFTRAITPTVTRATVSEASDPEGEADAESGA